jgi:hypothetical protein
MHRDNAVESGIAAIPRRAVGKVGADERGNLTDSIGGDTFRDHISYRHVALDMELPAVMVLDPSAAWKVLPLWGALRDGNRRLL